MLPFFERGSGSGASIGDSGGPAVINKNGAKTQIGVTSWGIIAGQTPGIYTNIVNYATWIETITGFTLNSSGVDLYTKDKIWDMGFEPFSYKYPWTSEDIWVRNNNDTIEIHQNPEYSMFNDSVYVKVRVRNKGCTASAGNEVLKLYWAKASTSLAWPRNWNGSVTIGSTPLGGSFSSIILPIIKPGSAYIATFPWLPPNPADYAAIASNSIFFANQPHHFCLLSRIEAVNDTMTFIETANTKTNVLNNNNIAWKNLSVVNVDSTNLTSPGNGTDVPIGATIVTGDPTGNGGEFYIKLCDSLEKNLIGVSEHAEITVTLDDPLWNLWESANFESENIQAINYDEKNFIAGNGCAILKDIDFQPDEFNLLHVSFNFLVEDYSTLQSTYDYSVVLTNSANQIFGGETYQINTSTRSTFDAEAGQDYEIVEGEFVQLSALQINEGAVYNWYDDNGALIYSGANFSVSPDVSQTYTLEVIATLDGYKDYDEVEVEVKTNYISSISPNPASNQIEVSYILEDIAQSAYLVLVKTQTSASSQFILNINQNSNIINTSNLTDGVYSVILVVDGVTKDYKNLLISH